MFSTWNSNLSSFYSTHTYLLNVSMSPHQLPNYQKIVLIFPRQQKDKNTSTMSKKKEKNLNSHPLIFFINNFLVLFYFIICYSQTVKFELSPLWFGLVSGPLTGLTRHSLVLMSSKYASVCVGLIIQVLNLWELYNVLIL